MMTYKIIYTQKALADLDAVASYIKLKLCNISASDRIIENFFGEGDSLASFPTLYPLCNDAFLRAWGIRFVPVKNYLLFYVVREDESAVYVIRFLYAKRAWQNILREYVKKEGGGFMPVFTTHYIQEETEKYGAKEKQQPWHTQAYTEAAEFLFFCCCCQLYLQLYTEGFFEP